MRIGIIGAGSGGYVAALRAAQLGAKVTLFEREKIGGTCLNVGCIPTKALIAGLNYARIAKTSSALGVSTGDVRIDLDKLQDHKETVVGTNVKGIEYLLQKRGVDLVRSNAVVCSKTTATADGEAFEFDKLIIATGSKPACIPGIKIDGKYVMSSDHALFLREAPKTMLVIGGGVIGLEFAGIFTQLGTKVTIVEMMDRLMPTDDEECSRAAQKFAQLGNIEVITQATVSQLFGDGDAVQSEIDTGREKVVRRFQKSLMAVGRLPNLDEAALTKLGVQYDRKGIKTDSFMQTSVKDVYAIGDCTGGYMLAHVAYAQAKTAVEHALGLNAHPMRYDNIPRVTFVHPEIAACGYTSAQLLERNLSVKWAKFSYMASGRARAQGYKEGFFKVGVDTDGIIRSAIVVGEEAGEMISFFSQAITMQTPIEHLENVIIAHPTLSEMAVEVIEAAAGHPLHS